MPEPGLFFSANQQPAISNKSNRQSTNTSPTMDELTKILAIQRTGIFGLGKDDNAAERACLLFQDAAGDDAVGTHQQRFEQGVFAGG